MKHNNNSATIFYKIGHLTIFTQTRNTKTIKFHFWEKKVVKFRTKCYFYKLKIFQWIDPSRNDRTNNLWVTLVTKIALKSSLTNNFIWLFVTGPKAWPVFINNIFCTHSKRQTTKHVWTLAKSHIKLNWTVTMRGRGMREEKGTFCSLVNFLFEFFVRKKFLLQWRSTILKWKNILQILNIDIVCDKKELQSPFATVFLVVVIKPSPSLPTTLEFLVEKLVLSPNFTKNSFYSYF